LQIAPQCGFEALGWSRNDEKLRVAHGVVV